MELSFLYEKRKCFISNTALIDLQKFTLEYPCTETGGDLFGIWDENGSPIISCVIGAGAKAEATLISFKQDMDFLKSERRRILEEKNLVQIGSWHSHHKMSLTEPSQGDINSIMNNLTDQTPKYLLFICNINANGLVMGNPVLFSKYNKPETLELKNTFHYHN